MKKHISTYFYVFSSFFSESDVSPSTKAKLQLTLFLQSFISFFIYATCRSPRVEKMLRSLHSLFPSFPFAEISRKQIVASFSRLLYDFYEKVSSCRKYQKIDTKIPSHCSRLRLARPNFKFLSFCSRFENNRAIYERVVYL